MLFASRRLREVVHRLADVVLDSAVDEVSEAVRMPIHGVAHLRVDLPVEVGRTALHQCVVDLNVDFSAQLVGFGFTLGKKLFQSL